MSNYNGRRAPNVSQYLANLNTIPTQQELSAQADLDLGNDRLDLLTSVDFFDFDAGSFAPNLDYTQQDPGFQFGELQTYPQSLETSPHILPPSPPNGLQDAYPSQQQPQPQQLHQQLQFAAHAPHHAGEKRKASFVQTPTPSHDLEESSRAAADEDKRRRNTAASARFRVKKKQREAALEKNAKELTDKVTALEGKVEQLEMENKWLKGLITEKGDRVPEKKAEERNIAARKDGVGTEKEAAEVEA